MYIRYTDIQRNYEKLAFMNKTRQYLESNPENFYFRIVSSQKVAAQIKICHSTNTVKYQVEQAYVKVIISELEISCLCVPGLREPG